MNRTLQLVPLLLESYYHCKQPTVPHMVVFLHWSELMEKEDTGMELGEDGPNSRDRGIHLHNKTVNLGQMDQYRSTEKQSLIFQRLSGLQGSTQNSLMEVSLVKEAAILLRNAVIPYGLWEQATPTPPETSQGPVLVVPVQ